MLKSLLNDEAAITHALELTEKLISNENFKPLSISDNGNEVADFVADFYETLVKRFTEEE